MVVYYIGRAAQLLGMWILLVDLFTAGPLGPNARLFMIGIAVFVVGWALVKIAKHHADVVVLTLFVNPSGGNQCW